MCATRTWKELNTIPNESSIKIIARRSDNLVVSVQTIIYPEDSPIRVSAKVKELMDKLEGFRNCKCSPKGPFGKCDKHI